MPRQRGGTFSIASDARQHEDENEEIERVERPAEERCEQRAAVVVVRLPSCERGDAGCRGRHAKVVRHAAGRYTAGVIQRPRSRRRGPPDGRQSGHVGVGRVASETRREGSEQRRRSGATPSSAATEQRSIATQIAPLPPVLTSRRIAAKVRSIRDRGTNPYEGERR